MSEVCLYDILKHLARLVLMVKGPPFHAVGFDGDFDRKSSETSGH